MSIHEASNGHTEKVAATRGGESVIPTIATHEMETDNKELPEDLLVDDVTMIAEAESTDYESS